MTATRTAVPPLPRLDKIEMEDRKRSLVNDVEDLQPSRKRFKDENGATMKMSEDKEKEVEVCFIPSPYRARLGPQDPQLIVSVQDYQKDAIMRQMKEYRRQKKDAEEQLAELHKTSQYHNDHLRTVDAWFSQLLDEVRVLASEILPTPPPSATSTTGMTSPTHHVRRSHTENMHRRRAVQVGITF